LYRVVLLVVTNAFEEHTAKIFQVLFLFMTPCCLISGYQNFGGIFSLHLLREYRLSFARSYRTVWRPSVR